MDEEDRLCDKFIRLINYPIVSVGIRPISVKFTKEDYVEAPYTVDDLCVNIKEEYELNTADL